MFKKIILISIIILGSINILVNTNEYTKNFIDINEPKKEIEVKSDFFSKDVKGIFFIPTIDIYLPIYSYDDVYDSMDKGMAFDNMTNKPNEKKEIVLMGHREKELYKLKKIKKEDKIYLITKEDIYEYKVNDLKKISKGDYKEVYKKSDKEELRILTCYPLKKYSYITGRFLVIANRVEKSDYNVKYI